MSVIKSPQIMSPHCTSAFVTVYPLQLLLTGDTDHLFSKGREERHVHLHVYLLQNLMYVTKWLHSITYSNNKGKYMGTHSYQYSNKSIRQGLEGSPGHEQYLCRAR